MQVPHDSADAQGFLRQALQCRLYPGGRGHSRGKGDAVHSVGGKFLPEMKDLNKRLSEIPDVKPVIIALVIRRAGEELLSVSPGEDCSHDLFHGRVILEGMEISHHGHQALPVLHDRSAELF